MWKKRVNHRMGIRTLEQASCDVGLSGVDADLRNLGEEDDRIACVG